MPVILASAQGFWQAARELREHVREAVVLARLAEEEAAKVLILMDMARCPGPLLASRIGDMVKWFYSHLARLIYAEAVSWRPMHVAQLREYVDGSRKSHDLDGAVGEYIVPNWTIFNREGVLYGDIAAYEGEGTRWNDPADLIHDFSFPERPPTVLKLAEAMSLLGMFSLRGLEITAETWATVEFKDKESFREANALTRTLIERLVAEKLPADQAGVASVIRSAAEFDRMRPGSILVCAMTNPAWTPLFAHATGLVTDIGGILAHGSVVAREYGIPAVLGTGNITERVKSGDIITVDGDQGTVTVHSS